MGRNAEVIRQWTILREIERARGAGVTIPDLATLCAVTTRTIRRDLQALEESGFPVYDDRSRDDGRTRWTMNGQAFKGLSAGLTRPVLGHEAPSLRTLLLRKERLCAVLPAKPAVEEFRNAGQHAFHPVRYRL